MADLIDKQSIVKKVAAFASTVIYRGCEEMITGKDSCNPAEWTRGYEKGVRDTANIILGQPPIDPESLRPKGEWILEHETYGKMICSRCKREALLEKKPDPYANGLLSLFYVTSDFCPRCGADMRGDDDAAD